MRDLLKKFEEKKPEITFEWHDAETDAKGWVVINSLRGGAAGGGTRMRIGLDKREVESLAKTMEVKFTVSGPAIGGAKSGIDFDPTDERKTGVLKRWYKAVFPLLKNYYGTGGDLNIDEIDEVIPVTEEFGLWHPQEGVVNGHYKATEPEKIKKLGQLRQGVSKVIEDSHYSPALVEKYTIADMITGFGVAESVRHYYDLWGGDISDKRAIIQGWGNVGAAAAFYLSKLRVKIIGIIDKYGGVISKDGLSIEEVVNLYVQRNGNKLRTENIIPFEEVDNQVWDLGAEVFIPAAASRLVAKSHLDRLITSGLEVVSSGANVPFSDPEIFLGPIGEFADNNVSVIPDFIANCGMARVFAYLMDTDVEMTDEAIFSDTSNTILEALRRTYNRNSEKTGIAQSAFEIALQQLV